jgi:hypothetical protein
MVAGFLLIVGVYGICAALIHLLYARQDKGGENRTYHLVLVTRDNQTHIEWYVYAYLFVSWLQGRQTVITVFDDGSTDETWKILQRIAETKPNVHLHSSTVELEAFLQEHENDPLLVLRLGQMEYNPKMPLPQW